MQITRDLNINDEYLIMSMISRYVTTKNCTSVGSNVLAHKTVGHLPHKRYTNKPEFDISSRGSS